MPISLGSLFHQSSPSEPTQELPKITYTISSDSSPIPSTTSIICTISPEFPSYHIPSLLSINLGSITLSSISSPRDPKEPRESGESREPAEPSPPRYTSSTARSPPGTPHPDTSKYSRSIDSPLKELSVYIQQGPHSGFSFACYNPLGESASIHSKANEKANNKATLKVKKSGIFDAGTGREVARLLEYDTPEARMRALQMGREMAEDRRTRDLFVGVWVVWEWNRELKKKKGGVLGGRSVKMVDLRLGGMAGGF
ncbi:hypothetical protein FPQ18DRAFT_396212 [Pyronema domesticum]|nr:hypothetical protein FPQ18DRAFT_396212 [Pyronema domesticum]